MSRRARSGRRTVRAGAPHRGRRHRARRRRDASRAGEIVKAMSKFAANLVFGSVHAGIRTMSNAITRLASGCIAVARRDDQHLMASRSVVLGEVISEMRRTAGARGEEVVDDGDSHSSTDGEGAEGVGRGPLHVIQGDLSRTCAMRERAGSIPAPWQPYPPGGARASHPRSPHWSMRYRRASPSVSTRVNSPASTAA